MSYPDGAETSADAVTNALEAENSSDQGESTVASDTPEVAPSPDTQQTPQADPPWKSFVEKFPEAFRPLAEEQAKEWDAGVTKRFQELHSTYEPYKSFVEQWEPESIEHALAIATRLNEDPQGFMAALAEAYGLSPAEQGSGTAQQPEEFDPDDQDEDNDNPFATQLAQQQELLLTLANHIKSREDAEVAAREQAEQDQWLDTTLTTLRETHGEFDEDYVLRAIGQGVEPEQAVQNFQSLVSTWTARANAAPSTAPRVMSAGGGLPSVQVDPAKLNAQETKNLVLEYIQSQRG